MLQQLSEIANSSSLDLDRLLERIAQVVRPALGCEIFAILLTDESTNELTVRYAIGHDEGKIRALRIPPGQGLTGAAVSGRAPVLVGDVSADGRYISGPEGVRSELAVPIMGKDRVLGVIDAQSPQPHYFTERHRQLLAEAAARVAVAVANARLYRSTLRQARILATLAEISREFSSILRLDELLRKIGELVRRLIAYDSFGILLLDEQTGVLKGYLSMRHREEFKEKVQVALGQGIVGHAAAEARSIVVPNVAKDPRYIMTNAATRAEMAVPLIAKDRVIGVLDLESTRRNFFTGRHRQMMEMLAPQIAIAIENARLYEKLAREEARMERDLKAARELQASLLPPCCPEIPGFHLHAKYDPAREIGGDLYDFIEYDAQPGMGRGLGIFTGDVSGKGAPAALYAALAHGLIRTVAARRQPTGQLLSKLNKVLCERRIEARSVALCYALLDLEKLTLEIANGGLPHPIICRGDELLSLRVEGIPLGLLENIEYESKVIELRQGDVAVFHTDGITEAFNPAHEEFGRGRLRDVIRRHCRESAGVLVERIWEETGRWAAGRAPSDDRTVVVLKYGEDGSCEVSQCG